MGLTDATQFGFHFRVVETKHVASTSFEFDFDGDPPKSIADPTLRKHYHSKVGSGELNLQDVRRAEPDPISIHSS